MEKFVLTAESCSPGPVMYMWAVPDLNVIGINGKNEKEVQNEGTNRSRQRLAAVRKRETALPLHHTWYNGVLMKLPTWYAAAVCWLSNLPLLGCVCVCVCVCARRRACECVKNSVWYN